MHAWFSAEDREPLHESRGRPFRGLRYRPAKSTELTAHQRRGLELRRRGLKFGQIGQMLGVTTSTAHALVTRAKATLLRKAENERL